MRYLGGAVDVLASHTALNLEMSADLSLRTESDKLLCNDVMRVDSKFVDSNSAVKLFHRILFRRIILYLWHASRITTRKMLASAVIARGITVKYMQEVKGNTRYMKQGKYKAKEA